MILSLLILESEQVSLYESIISRLNTSVRTRSFVSWKEVGGV